jgi:nucleotide-binding universal stress UspA family protein
VLTTPGRRKKWDDVSTDQVDGGGGPCHLSTALRNEMQGRAQRELTRLLPEGPGAPVDTACQVIVGVPPQQILEAAVAKQVDLIVMATHGRTGLSHLVMGSVAERVVRTAPCPVLTIRSVIERSGVPLYRRPADDFLLFDIRSLDGL